MPIDTIDDILNVHERHGKPTSLIDLMRSLRLREQEISRAGYRTEIALEKTRALRDEAVSAYVAEVNRLKADRAQAAVETLREFDAAQDAVTGESAKVDVARLLAAQSAAEIGLMVRDAIASGDAKFARTTWGHARPELLRRASREQREHQLPGRNSALTMMTMLDAEMASLNRRQPDRHAVVERERAAEDDIERQALEVARVLNLDQAVAAALRRSVLVKPENTGGLVFGSFWEMQQSRR